MKKTELKSIIKEVYSELKEGTENIDILPDNIKNTLIKSGLSKVVKECKELDGGFRIELNTQYLNNRALSDISENKSVWGIRLIKGVFVLEVDK